MSDLQFVTNTITRAEQRTGPDGRQYLVASGVAIVEGVLGNELVLASEFGRHVQGWAGRPLVVDHPEKDGYNISANSPDMLEQMAIGQFWNPRVDGNRLVGEYWFDIEKIQRLGGDAQQIAQALSANRPVEESTAYFRDLDKTSGEWNGKPYTGIARNIVPDHVAVLANKIGKCSLADGCGVLVNSESGDCGCGCGGASKQDQSVESGEQVQPEQPSNDIGSDLGDNMSKENEEVQANAQAEDKELNGLTEAALAMVANAVETKLAPLQEKLNEYDKWFSDNGGFEQVRETLQLARSHSQAMAVNAKRERDALVTALVANERCRFTAEQLEKLDIEALGALAESLQPVDYSGRGFAANRRDAGVELKPLEMPEVK